MNLHEYKEKALRTESKVDRIVANAVELNYVFGAFQVVSEMLDCLKKKIYYNNPKKYNEQFHDLAEKLHYMTTCCDRHHDIVENSELPINPRVFHGIIGLATESGELVSALQLALNGHELDGTNVGEEIGDKMWYISILCDALGLDPYKILDTNIKKLSARFPEKYSDYHAEHRDLDTERKILEA